MQDDIIFSKNINDYFIKEKFSNRHASTNNLISNEFRIVTVKIDNSVKTSGKNNWYNEILSAMSEYNSLPNTSISFVEYVWSNDPDIIIKSDSNNLPGNTIAAAQFPINGKAGNQILINLDFNNNMTVSSSTKKYNIVHELGHCIGFRHTNWDLRNEGISAFGANLIPGTPSQDPNSVMNGGTALFSWNNFSQYDVIAINYLCPISNCNGRIYIPSSGTCAFDRNGDSIEYNVLLNFGKQTNPFNSNINYIYSMSSSTLEISSTYSQFCKIRVKSNNTIWPAAGVITCSNNGCVVTKQVSLNNCIDYSYSD